MELLLIRHARPHRVVGGAQPADPSLDATGRAQARAVATWLAGDDLAAIYASPLARARETADALAARLSLPVSIHDGLAEWDRDSATYIPVEDLKATDHPLWAAMTGQRWDELGVDIDAFVTRVSAALDDIVRAHPSQRVAVVCHGGVINAAVATMLGLDRVLFFEPGYTSINRLLVSRGGVWSLQSLNEIAHLRGVDTA